MSYQGSFHDIVYPDETGSPCVLRYRIAFTNAPHLLAVVHLQQTEPSFASPVSSLTVRDQILNRIVDERLAGVPIGAIRVAVEDSTGVFGFDLEFDLHDYIQRGRPYDSSPVIAGGGRFREEISISSDRIVGGSVRIHTAHASPEPLSAEVAAALA
ncbi:hypothetical protein [Paraburkholderia sediminicola]|uniref:hypothetical protein n=1 Tax=Paraburkholderia sediminicola TaxID=458836 RepID=UPI0038B6F3AD